MNITLLTIMQDGQVITATKSKEVAVSTAQARAKMTGSPVSVVADLDDGRGREVIFTPDGTNEKIWDIDKGQRMEPVVGQVYTNRSGGRFRCIARRLPGPRSTMRPAVLAIHPGYFRTSKAAGRSPLKGSSSTLTEPSNGITASTDVSRR